MTVADLNEKAAQEVVQEIVNQGGTATAFYVAVTSPESVEKLVNETSAQFGKLDFMFNNAGITVTGEFRDLPLDEIKKVLDVNLIGVLQGSHFAYQTMIRQGFGHIVNTASGFGLAPGPTKLPYVMSKFGIVGLSESLRFEGLDLGVKVSVVCPGYIQTPLVEKVRAFNVSPQRKLWFPAVMPISRFPTSNIAFMSHHPWTILRYIEHWLQHRVLDLVSFVPGTLRIVRNFGNCRY